MSVQFLAAGQARAALETVFTGNVVLQVISKLRPHCKKYNTRIPSFGKEIPNIGKEILFEFSPSHTNINLEVFSYI